MTEEKYKKAGFLSQEQYDFPAIVNICVYKGACPCECVHCPVGLTPREKRGSQFGQEEMRLELFKKIVDEVAQHSGSAIRVHAVGEPLLWPSLKDALEYAKNRGVKSWIFTSAVTKDAALLDMLVKNCSIIEVSVNSFDPEDYRKTKGIDQFHMVKRNVRRMRDYKVTNNLGTRILASRVESPNKEYDSAFIGNWLKTGLVDDSFIRAYHNYNNAISNKFDAKVVRASPCLVHWSRFNIDCSGDALLCFNELFKGPKVNPEVVLGNVGLASIAEVWHSGKIEKVRKAQLCGDYKIVDFAEKIPCEECFSCQPLDSGKPTSENQLKRLMS